MHSDPRPPLGEYLSPAEFGRRVGRSLPTVRRDLDRGLIPYSQPAGRRGHIRIPAEFVAEFLAARPRDPKPPTGPNPSLNPTPPANGPGQCRPVRRVTPKWKRNPIV